KDARTCPGAAMARGDHRSTRQRALVILTGAVLFMIVIACLYWAQAVFIPVALAIFLTFVLAPVVAGLQRRGLGRVPAVVLTAALAALILTGVGWAVAHQVTGLI